MKLQIVLLFVFIFAIGCTSEKKSYTIPDRAITIMAYNVENLFDTIDDPKKMDNTYLPASEKTKASHKKSCQSIRSKGYRSSCLNKDWSQEKLTTKMARLADAILRVKNGQGPDVLVLEEVENIEVLEELRKKHLARAGYKKAILIESPDKRGIDVGMLSRLPEAAPAQLHKVQLQPQGKLKKSRIRPTRGILHAKFALPDGTQLNVLGVHFPSQMNPTESRLQAIQLLNRVTGKIPKTELTVVAGDFNISKKEALFQEKLARNGWIVSHIKGCKACPGTHNYRGEWSFLDALLFSQNLAQEKGTSPWMLANQSIRVSTLSPYQMDPKTNLPARFKEGMRPFGVSDHLPVVAEIVPRETTE